MRYGIIGSGGFAREVRWMLDEIHRGDADYEFIGYLVSDPDRAGPYDDTDHTVGGFDRIGAADLGLQALAMGIGTPALRYELGQELTEGFPDVSWPPLIHPSVQLDRSTSSIGAGAIVCAGTVLTVNVEVREFAMINLLCSIGHEATIGSGSVINPLTAISGGVSLGERVLVGTGASVLQYLSVGDDSTVGAGAVVTKDVAAGSTVVGVPARPAGS